MKKGVSAMVLGLVVFSLVLIFVIVAVFYQGKDATLSAIENSILEPFFDFVNTDTVDDLPLLSSQEVISETYAEYVEELVLLYDNEEELTENPTGYITIVDAPPVGDDEPENVFAIFSPYTRTVQDQEINGTSLRLAQQLGDSTQQALVASPRDTPFLRGKKLCVFPRDRESPSALYALHSVTDIPFEETNSGIFGYFGTNEELPAGYSLETAVRNNEVDEVVIHFNVGEEQTSIAYTRGQLTETYSLTTEDQEYFVMLHLGEYLCFFGTDNGEFEFGSSYDIDLADNQLIGNLLLDEDLAGDLRQRNQNTIKRGIQ